MATMEKQKVKQGTRKSKSKRLSESQLLGNVVNPSTSTRQNHLVHVDIVDKAEDVSFDHKKEAKKSDKEALSAPSDTEDSPLLPESPERVPINQGDEQRGLLESSESSPLHNVGSGLETCISVENLIQVESLVHNSASSPPKDLVSEIHINPKTTCKPIGTLLEEIQAIKSESDVKEALEHTIKHPNVVASNDQNAKEASPIKSPDFGQISQKLLKMRLEAQTEPKSEINTLQENVGQPIIRPFSDLELSALYLNEELESCTDFVSNFVEFHLRPTSKCTHPLYDLLLVYLRAINRLVMNSMELKAMKKEANENQSQLWILETTTVTESGECQDGNPVTASHAYQISRLNRRALVQFGRLLAGLRELVNATHSLDAYLCEATRLQIESLVQCVSLGCPEFVSLAQNADVALTPGPHSSSLSSAVTELKTCIAILFSFQRRPSREERFVHDTQEWLSRLIAVLLRVASWQDHMFILNHVLRCPTGVGKWAACFIQTPLPAVQNPSVSLDCMSPFTSPYVDHMMATLATIVLPIRERSAFLEQFRISLEDFNGTTDAWIVIDSEDEDEEGGDSSLVFRENDLVALLNQVAIGPMFRLLLCVQQQGDEDIWTGLATTPQHFLRLLAFGSVLVRLLRRGLEALAAPRYKQLSKRLGRLVRHTVQYASDVWQIIRETFIHENDPVMAVRLQVEYDSFLVRATCCIYSSRHLGAWQFLAILPYSQISLNVLWPLWSILHMEDISEDSIVILDKSINWDARVQSASFRSQFEERLVSMQDAESYYLLTTYANMALSRPQSDWSFIRAACLDLLQIGFLSSTSQEACSKSVRILLGGLVAKNPPLLSEIIAKLAENFSAVGKLSLYLFRELPLSQWQPTREDIAILSHWLLRSLISPESVLARYILTNLNWGFDMNGELFLVPQLHRDVSILVLKAALQHVPDTAGPTSIIMDSVKQVSSMILSQTPDQVFSQWLWDMFARLRLHLLDQSRSTVWRAMSNLSEMLPFVPDIDDERLVDVALGVKKAHTAASFIAVAVTQIGHSIPLICNQGFEHLLLLLNHGRYEAVLSLLQHIIPLFLECVSSLTESEMFLSVIAALIQADRTYMKMALCLIASDFPGIVTRSVGNMIQSHLEYHERYNVPGPAPFVSLWIQVLTKIPDWSCDPAVLYLLDIISRTAFFDQESKSIVSSFLRRLFQKSLGGMDDEIGQGSRQGGALSSIMSWVASGAQAGSPLIPTVSCANHVWYAFFALEVEQDEIEDKTGLWKEVQKELAAMTGKAHVDAALKKASNTLKRPAISPSMFSIYRWSQQALDTPVDHPLLPLLWQKFFFRFLCRVPSPVSCPLGSIGPKFFEGMANLIYLKRIKKKLQECKEHYWAAIDECKVEEPERRTWLESTARMLWTMGVWLEEPRLHEPTLYLPALPPLYNAEKLAQMVQGDKKLWLELIDYESIREIQLKAAEQWEATQFRLSSPKSPSGASSKLLTTTAHRRDHGKTPIERILKRLQSYDTPERPPALKQSTAVLPSVRQECLQSQNATLDALKEPLRIILEYAQLYALRISEHTALDCTFLEMVPVLYRDVETEVTLHATCQSEGYQNNHHNTVTCAGPATIRIKIREARVSDRTEHSITQNRSDCESVLTRAMQPPPLKVCASSVKIEQTVKLLANEYIFTRDQGMNAVQAAQRVHVVGVELFYHLVARYNEDLALYPPTKQLIATCLEILGQVFISGDKFQCERLLSCMVQHPRLAGLLGPHFTPSVASVTDFLLMYRSVVDIALQPNSDLSFVLLSKFDVGQWLSEKKPKPSECSQFIENVVGALTALGPIPSDEKLIVHEMYCNHLRLMLKYRFPEHFGTVLILLLKASENQTVCVDIWYAMINVILSLGVPQMAPGSPPILNVRPDMNPGRIMEELRQYAANQKLLHFQELKDTAAILASHFNRERLQYGLYGLYPKYRAYVEALSIFLGLVGHAFVVSALQNGCGKTSNQLVEELWPALSAMFFPWIAPYWTDQLTEPTASWIQQLTDDRSVLPPWIVGDAQHGQRLMGTFVEVMRFVLDTLPASSNLLGYIWQFYVSHFAHTSIKEHTLSVVHTNLLTLPWMRFWPTPSHLELMLKVVDQYLPDCHAFLGSVFIEVAWGTWLSQLSTAGTSGAVVRVHICLLHLLIKLANEPNVIQSGKILTLLVEARKFAWNLVDAQDYQSVVNWYVMSVDPKAVLRLEDQETGATDNAVIHLLQVAADYTISTTRFHSTTLRKRQIFVRACVKVLVNCASRFKSMLESNKEEFRDAVQRMLDDIESVVGGTVPALQQVPEAGLLLTEVLGVVNQPPGSPLGLLGLNSCVTWLQQSTQGADSVAHKSGCSVVVQALLKIVGSTIGDSAALGSILEATFEAYFNSVGEESEHNWSSAVSILRPTTPRQPPIEDVLISNGNLLSLHGLLLLQLCSCRDIREEAILLNSLNTWLGAVRPSEQLEAKLPLLWCQVLRLSQRQISQSGDRAAACSSLRQLVQHASVVAEHKAGGWGLLGAIGIGKQLSVSTRCRLLCRFVCAYVSAQLPDCRTDINLVRASPNSAGSVTQGPHSRNDQSLDIHPTAEAIRNLGALEALLSNKIYAGIRFCIETSVAFVRNPENSLHNAEEILLKLVKQLYSEKYLHTSLHVECFSSNHVVK